MLGARWVSVRVEILTAWRSREWVEEAEESGERQGTKNPCELTDGPRTSPGRGAVRRRLASWIRPAIPCYP